MSSIDNLLETVQHYYHENGEWPKVVISKDFWKDHANDIAKLSRDGIDIEVKEHLHFKPLLQNGL